MLAVLSAVASVSSLESHKGYCDETVTLCICGNVVHFISKGH